MKHSFSKIYVGAIALLIGASSCSDQFLKDKKDYNNMTTVDVYSDPQQATAVFATIYKQIISRYNSPLCGADPLMRQDQATGGKQYIFFGRDDWLEKWQLHWANYQTSESGKSYFKSALLE